jgi:hypothetical protein
MPGPPWDGQFENYTELAAALSVLGGGAVGFSDELGFENRTLIMACAMEDGTLLTPSRPSHYLVSALDPNAAHQRTPQTLPNPKPAPRQDMMYLPSGAQPFSVAVGRILQAPTLLRDSPYVATTVLAIDVPAHFFLLPQHLTPDLSAPQAGVVGHLALRWAPGFAALEQACADGAALSGCAARFDARNGIDLFTDTPAQNYTHFHEIVSISPLFATGFALLGELGKFVRVAYPRFAALAPTGDGMSFSVLGARNEQLQVLVAAGDVVRRVDVAFAESAWVAVTCSGSGPQPCKTAAAPAAAPRGR